MRGAGRGTLAEWAADADEQTLVRPGLPGRCPQSRQGGRPLQHLDADHLITWPVRGRLGAPRQNQQRGGGIVMDGKTSCPGSAKLFDPIYL